MAAPTFPALASGGAQRAAVAEWAAAGTTRIAAMLVAIERQIRRNKPTGDVLRLLVASKQELFHCLRGHAASPVAARALTLKVLNLCLAKHHYLARATALRSRPFGLVIDPSNGCHLACPGCVHSERARELFDWRGGMLSEARAAALLARYGPYAIQAIFCNYGEPLLNPATARIVRLAKGYLMGTMLSTNLSVRHFDAEACTASGLDYMIVSIDGATQSVYERYRRGGDLDLVYGNIRKLVAARRRLGSRTPVIAWQFLAFEHNAHEIGAAAGIARELGVDRFAATTPFDVSWDDPAIRPAAVAPFTLEFDDDSDGVPAIRPPVPGGLDAAAIDREFAAAWSEGPPDREPSPAGAPADTCPWLYKNLVMDAAGRIFPCCAAPRPDAPLTFATLDAGSDPFNSLPYRLARLSFANRPAYQRAAARLTGPEPHCAACDWERAAANVDSAQIRQYLDAAGGGMFDAASVRILAGW